MYAEKVAARYDPHSNSVSGVITPTPPHPPPHHSKVGKYGMISHRQFYFHILKPSSGCYVHKNLPEAFCGSFGLIL